MGFGQVPKWVSVKTVNVIKQREKTIKLTDVPSLNYII